MSSGTVAVPTRKSLLSDRQYDALKYVAQIILPALGTLYTALAALWGFPYVTQVVGTIVAVDAFLGLALRISTNRYEALTANDFHGTVGLLEFEDGAQKVRFDVQKDADELVAGKTVTFKVVPKQPARYAEDDEV